MWGESWGKEKKKSEGFVCATSGFGIRVVSTKVHGVNGGDTCAHFVSLPYEHTQR